MKTNAKKVIEELEKRLKKAMEEAPLVMGNAGQNLFVSSFRKQGWGDDGIVEKWKARKKTTKKNAGKSLLVGTGRLRKSVGSSLKSYNKNRIVWGVYLPYAQIQNEGGTINKSSRKGTLYFKTSKSGDIKKGFVKKKKSNFAMDVNIGSHNITIPARPFMINGYILRRLLKKKYIQVFKANLKR